jgi:hypothetical protein
MVEHWGWTTVAEEEIRDEASFGNGDSQNMSVRKTMPTTNFKKYLPPGRSS